MFWKHVTIRWYAVVVGRSNGELGQGTWSRTAFTRLVGIDLPIVLAPLAGGPSTPALAAAVCQAGGLGSLGVGYLSPDAIRHEVREIRAAIDRPFAVNLFVPSSIEVDPNLVAAAWTLLEPFRQELGMPDEEPPVRFQEDFDDQLQVIVDAKVPVVSFTFVLRRRDVIDALHAEGGVVISTVTSEAEAMAAATLPLDALCAQGSEAGGHRGSFLGDDDGPVGLMALVPRVVDGTGLPVVASGGLMDGRGVAAVLALGAGAAQLGTAFLQCPEAGTSLPYRQALAAADGTTVVTRAFSGKPARGLPTRFARELPEGTVLPPYPVMNALTRGLRKRAAELDRPEFLSLWAGQAVAAARAQPASDLVTDLAREADSVIAQLSAHHEGAS